MGAADEHTGFGMRGCTGHCLTGRCDSPCAEMEAWQEGQECPSCGGVGEDALGVYCNACDGSGRVLPFVGEDDFDEPEEDREASRGEMQDAENAYERGLWGDQ